MPAGKMRKLVGNVVRLRPVVGSFCENVSYIFYFPLCQGFGDSFSTFSAIDTVVSHFKGKMRINQLPMGQTQK